MSKRKQLDIFFLLYVIILFAIGFLYATYISSKPEITPVPGDWSGMASGLGTAISEGIKEAAYFLSYVVLISCLFYTGVYLFLTHKRGVLFLLIPLINLVLFVAVYSLVHAVFPSLKENDYTLYGNIVLSYLAGSFVLYRWFAARVSSAPDE